METALITGAGRGIGAATARELARRRFHVIVNYHRDRASADAVVKDIEAAGGTARPLQADVRDPSQVAGLVAECGPVDVLVCNANVAPPFAPLREMSWETFIGKVDGELAAAFHITQAVLADMPEGGRIVYVSSLSAELTRPTAVAHSTAKAALDTFARYVAAEAGTRGIAVNVVAPGAVRTEGSAGNLTPAFESVLEDRSVLGRMVEPEDVATVIASLTDGDFRAVSGVRVQVDAGFRVLTAP
ncbi:SDR family oxidoreductase [Actinomadura rubrisoli]|uniref:SDR family oxidoreductase n=1 Tax=Actinomadura rubrisoli TaxID=2530368 RepID=A0A4R5BW44_9ACTN|nr:SDR family oxidoreductase [Actinomadura rubrisoli]TDD91351.1 SDR family oxidoreductase [Actinomadura rubrisoli]